MDAQIYIILFMFGLLPIVNPFAPTFTDRKW
jgi:hypothetical protein